MRRIAPGVVLLVCLLVNLVRAQDSKQPPGLPQITEKQLEQWLKEYPDADADKNGKLTREEAIAYYLKLQAQQKQKTAPTQANVKYGTYKRNVLDFWQAKSDKPTPVLIHFHGGGFVAGDKNDANPDPYLQNGISVVSANYRFVKGGDEPAPYPAPMHDGARVVQFIRFKAKEWNIDPNRIALTGGSAGAVMTLWIGYHDDLAKADSDDPVAKLSTRVACLVPIAAPTNLDPDYIRQHIGGNPLVHPSINPFFGVDSEQKLRTADKQRDVKEASPMTHVSKDDPPTFQLYPGELSKTPLPPDTDINTSIHHAQFGVLLKEKLDAAGVPNEIAYADDGRSRAEQLVAVQLFLKKHLLGK
jgi:acetyl esterase/lipase